MSNSNDSKNSAKKINEIRENEIKDLLARSNISLCLDSYNDLFSDFDPRPYSERALSDDFLQESKRAAREKTGSLELKFLMHSKDRMLGIETTIRKRLRDHFKKHYDLLDKEKRKVVTDGMLITFVGFVLMVIATSLYRAPENTFLITLLIVILEPAGWFTVWYGLDKIFYIKNEKATELEFYNKMSRANIRFDSY